MLRFGSGCITKFRKHWVILFVLLGASVIYFKLPLRLQAMEPYAYAAAIEGYYDLSQSFSVAQGYPLPNFSRYHPNHPLGHALLGAVYDLFSVPALEGMFFLNMVSILISAVFLYLLCLYFNFKPLAAALTSALFLSSYVSLFAVFSGEFHAPALALAMGGVWQACVFIDTWKKKALWYATLFFTCASVYHLDALFLTILMGFFVLYYVLKEKQFHAVIFPFLFFIISLIIFYIVIPVYIFKLHSVDDFFKYFFIYVHKDAPQFSIFAWLWAMHRTMLDAVVFVIPITEIVLKATVAFWLFFLWKAIDFWKNAVRVKSAKMATFIFTAGVLAYAILGVRPDGLLGWLYLIPFLFIFVSNSTRNANAWSLSLRLVVVLAILSWNILFAIWPNSIQRDSDRFFFDLPREISKDVPIAFVIGGDPVLMHSEAWYAGSKRGYRNQTFFLPAYGEYNFPQNLDRWLKEYPKGVVVTDKYQANLEQLLLRHKQVRTRWLDRAAQWPEQAVPITLNVERGRNFFYNKRLTVWIPKEE